MDLDELAEALKAGTISIGEWEAGMRGYLREQYMAATILSKGGREFVTPSDWGYEGSLLKKQYAYLSNFANDIKNNPSAWMNGRLNSRMDLYKESAYAALEDMNRREHIEQGYDEERRVLGAADHCPDCLDYAGQGWQPIGTLPAIGDSVCLVNCKCIFEYRRSTDMLFAPAQSGTDMLFAPGL